MMRDFLPIAAGAVLGAVTAVAIWDVAVVPGNAPGDVRSQTGAAAFSAPDGDASSHRTAEATGVVDDPSEAALRVDNTATSPRVAVRDALALDQRSQQRSVLMRIAIVAARVDPRAALHASADIPQFELRDAYRAAVLAEWGRNDPAALLAYAAANPFDVPAEAASFAGAAGADAKLVLASLSRLPGPLRAVAERAAIDAQAAMLEELAREDPAAAAALAGEISSGGAGGELLRAVARGYARRDLRAALDWLHSLPQLPPGAIVVALAGAAEYAPASAVPAIIDELSSAERVDFALRLVVQPLLRASPSSLSGFADQLLANDAVHVRSAYREFLGMWTADDPEAASAWVLANLGRVPDASVETVVRELARRDLASARRVVESLPADRRALGIGTAAAVVGRTDVEEAVRWVGTLGGQPGFVEALEALLSVAFEADPAGPSAIAALLDGQPDELAARVAPRFATLFAQRDPAAAARWVLALDVGSEREPRRLAALRNVARAWGASDVTGAEKWVSSLPAGGERDEVLRIIVPLAAHRDSFDENLLDAFVSATLREAALLDAVAAIARADMAAARRLIDREIADPDFRRQAERRLLEAGAASPTLRPAFER